MTKFESSVKQIPYPVEDVYRNISDLSNLERVRDRIPQDKLQDFQFDSDSVQVSVSPVGTIKLRICEREENKCVKFETEQSPMPFNLWIQVLPVDSNSSKMKVTVKADIPFMLKGMVSGPLQDGVEKIADALSQIPFCLTKHRIFEASKYRNIEIDMANKLWEKNFEVNAEIERFTVGRDREMDLYLAKYDVLGSMAHITMLESIGLIGKDELPQLLAELKNIYQLAQRGEFVIEEGVEDVHSQVELMLTRKLGDMGKKIHSGRSRNDQVLVDLKLFTRHELMEVAEAVKVLFDELIQKSEQYKHVLMPGYTHLQVAMPSSFGLWFGAYAESLTDDMLFLQAAYKMTNRNPLGSAAGYGSSFPLNRQMTTDLLGFDSMDYNVVYAQMGRGKTERNVGFALATIAGTLAKMAFDACMFNSQNFSFVKLPKECTTGSSIMPHKKNPDVFELIRAKCNKIQALPQQVTLIMNNLPVGYFRDLQIIKEVFLPAFDELKDCLQMAAYIINKIEVRENILDNPMYDPMFSVETVNKLAAEGLPFREAYKKVGLDIEAGTFRPDKDIHHTHEGSIGNLCNDRISALMSQVFEGFAFERMTDAEKKLLG